jgi:hypothetical protein
MTSLLPTGQLSTGSPARALNIGSFLISLGYLDNSTGLLITPKDGENLPSVTLTEVFVYTHASGWQMIATPDPELKLDASVLKILRSSKYPTIPRKTHTDSGAHS